MEKGEKILPVIIIAIILLIFFISTRDYDKFKLMNKEHDLQYLELVPIADATDKCNRFIEENYREKCYEGIKYAVGYIGFENYLELCSKLSDQGDCYKGAGKGIGEKYYDNFSFIIEQCEKSKDNGEPCTEFALINAGKMLAYHNKDIRYCETFEEEYKSPCYIGISLGLANQYYPDFKAQLVSNCNPLEEGYKSSCYAGFFHAGMYYATKHPSYVEVLNNRVILAIQQNEISEKMLNITSSFAGFYFGSEYFKEQELAFSLCDNLTMDLDKKFKEQCYEVVFKGIGYSYYFESKTG